MKHPRNKRRGGIGGRLIFIVILVAIGRFLYNNVPFIHQVVSPNAIVWNDGGGLYKTPEVYTPSQIFPDGCNGSVSEFIDNWPGTYSVPRGGESDYIDLGDFHGIKITCDGNGISGYYAVSDPNPKGVEWALDPSQPLVCTDGPLQVGVWYAVWSSKGYLPYDNIGVKFLKASKEWPTYLRYEGMAGEMFLFQRVGGPSDPMETFEIKNAGGVLGCAITDQKYEYLFIPGFETDSDD